MLTQIINGHILTPQGWLKDGSVLISDGKILEVTNSDLAVIGATVIDAKGMYIVPGFISMHAYKTWDDVHAFSINHGCTNDCKVAVGYF